MPSWHFIVWNLPFIENLSKQVRLYLYSVNNNMMLQCTPGCDIHVHVFCIVARRHYAVGTGSFTTQSWEQKFIARGEEWFTVSHITRCFQFFFFFFPPHTYRASWYYQSPYFHQLIHRWTVLTHWGRVTQILRFYITTVRDGWCKSAFLKSACFPCTIHLIMQYIEPVSEWSCWRMFIETWPHSELNFRHRASSI